MLLGLEGVLEEVALFPEEFDALGEGLALLELEGILVYAVVLVPYLVEVCVHVGKHTCEGLEVGALFVVLGGFVCVLEHVHAGLHIRVHVVDLLLLHPARIGACELQDLIEPQARHSYNSNYYLYLCLY